MPNVISNFLVGIGFDYDQKGAQKIEGGIDSIKSKALQAGAVVAGAFGVKALTADFANANDKLGKFSRVFGVIPNEVAALGRALEHEGGSIESFMGQLEGIERLRAGLLRGDASFIAQAGIAGIDPSVITNAKSASDAYKALGDQFARLSRQQRLNAAEALGLDESSIRLLSQGTDAVSAAAEAQKRIRPVTEGMTKAAADFNDEMQDLGSNIGGVADRISTKLLPEINNIVRGTNQWFDANRAIIGQNLDKALVPIADNFAAIASAGGLIATGGLLKGLAVMSGSLPVIGSALAGIATSAAAISGIGASAAAGVAVGTGIRKSGILDKPAQWLGFDDYQNYFDFLMDPIFGTNVSGRWGGDAQVSKEVAAPYAMGLSPISQTSGHPQYWGSSSYIKPLQVNLMLDGQVLDSRIINVTDRQNEQAIQDLTNSTGG